MKLFLVFVMLVAACGEVMAAARIKDITSVRGVRGNQLIGYGIVSGLKGTGDGRGSPFTRQSLEALTSRFGVDIGGKNAQTKNIASVVVTAELPPFARPGGRIDVVVSSLGDATSLAGGVLLLTALYAPDGQIYAAAQGSVAVSGFDSQGQAASLTVGVPTTGRIPNGALVERAAPGNLAEARGFGLELQNPDFSTAIRVADTINTFTRARYGEVLAWEQDNRTISTKVPRGVSPARFLAEIGALTVTPDVPARVVVDERTGTIVIGENVKVSTVAITHGNLTVRVTETPEVVQPLPFSNGETAVEPMTDIAASQEPGVLSIVKGADLQTLVSGLNRIGLKPPGIIAILQAMKSSGALQAELVIQ